MYSRLLIFCIFIFFFICSYSLKVFGAEILKTASLHPNTPQPKRFIIQNNTLFDVQHPGKTIFFKGIGYSPYLINETPLFGAPPADDGRFAVHIPMMKELGVNYLHVFPRQMPSGFFKALDSADLVYGQDIWMFPYEPDYLNPAYQQRQLNSIKQVIDHTYAVGRPDRLVLFSIGDELQAASVTSTNAAHPTITAYKGKYVQVSGRTAAEIAIAKLIDEAMDYEISTYGQRHLYCHTSWTHIGPIHDRPDLEVQPKDAFTPDMGDLVCLNIYPYANAVRTSAPGSITQSSYQGYLEQLAREVKKPIFITQVGLSTSPIAPKPSVPGFGGHSAQKVVETYASIWRDVRSAQGRERFCGLVFFEWQDEWWKSGEDSTDATRHEPHDPEEWFGIFELGPNNQLIPKGGLPAKLKELYSEP